MNCSCRFFLCILFLFASYAGCRRTAPAHLTAAEMAELRELAQACSRAVKVENGPWRECMKRFEARVKSLLSQKEVVAEDVCYALRFPFRFGCEGCYNVVWFSLGGQLSDDLCLFLDDRGVVTRACFAWVSE